MKSRRDLEEVIGSITNEEAMAMPKFNTLNSNANVKFYVQNDGEVKGYTLGGSSEYKSVMDTNASDNNIKTPDDVFNTTPIGTEFSFNDHKAGAQIIFTLRVFDTGHYFYSNSRTNYDGMVHIAHQNIELNDGTQGVIIGFEDIYGGGDMDFNDNVVLFTNVSAVDLIL